MKNSTKATDTLTAIADDAVNEALEMLQSVLSDSTRYTPGSDHERAWRLRSAQHHISIAIASESLVRKIERA